jgi:hypothetical protein
MLRQVLVAATFVICVMGTASAQQPPAMTQQTANIKRTPLQNSGSGCCQALNTSLVPVYDRIAFFGNSALRIS